MDGVTATVCNLGMQSLHFLAQFVAVAQALLLLRQVTMQIGQLVFTVFEVAWIANSMPSLLMNRSVRPRSMPTLFAVTSSVSGLTPHKQLMKLCPAGSREIVILEDLQGRGLFHGAMVLAMVISPSR